MASRHDTMMNPPIEGLLERAGSKFTLVTLGSKRARQINSYYNQLSEGLGTVVPPQVTSSARKPLSIAFEEISADKIIGYWPDPEAEGEAADTDAGEDPESAS
jgi:DNA-directed RNA polymerase subunit omega